MTIIKALILTLLLGAFAASASAANFSGKWTMEMAGGRPGRTTQTTLILNQVGNELTGSITGLGGGLGSGSPTGTEIYGGKVEGDTITFYTWIGQDRPAKMVYQGTMSGDGIHFTVTGSPVRFNVRGERIDPPGPREVMAKRTK